MQIFAPPRPAALERQGDTERHGDSELQASPTVQEDAAPADGEENIATAPAQVEQELQQQQCQAADAAVGAAKEAAADQEPLQAASTAGGAAVTLHQPHPAQSDTAGLQLCFHPQELAITWDPASCRRGTSFVKTPELAGVRAC